MWISLFGYVGDIPYRLKDYLVGINFIVIFVETYRYMNLKDKKRIAKLMEMYLMEFNFNYDAFYSPYRATYSASRVRYSSKHDRYYVEMSVGTLTRRTWRKDPVTFQRVRDEQGNFIYDYPSMTNPNRSQVFRINRDIRFYGTDQLMTAANMFSIDRYKIEINKIDYSKLRG